MSRGNGRRDSQGYELGWSYVQLRGKRPVERGWTDRPRESLEQALGWARDGNVGIRTGGASGGLVVIDIDAGAETAGLDLTDTVTVRTGSGGLHFYYQVNQSVRNSAGTIAPRVDFRGDDGPLQDLARSESGGPRTSPPELHRGSGRAIRGLQLAGAAC